jgi:hypothetical protein
LQHRALGGKIREANAYYEEPQHISWGSFTMDASGLTTATAAPSRLSSAKRPIGRRRANPLFWRRRYQLAVNRSLEIAYVDPRRAAGNDMPPAQHQSLANPLSLGRGRKIVQQDRHVIARRFGSS